VLLLIIAVVISRQGFIFIRLSISLSLSYLSSSIHQTSTAVVIVHRKPQLASGVWTRRLALSLEANRAITQIPTVARPFHSAVPAMRIANVHGVPHPRAALRRWEEFPAPILTPLVAQPGLNEFQRDLWYVITEC